MSLEMHVSVIDCVQVDFSGFFFSFKILMKRLENMNVNYLCLVESCWEERSNICIHIKVANIHHLVMEYNGFKL